TVMRALMLLILRPEPSRITSWDRNELNAGDIPFATALLFSGYLSGRKRLSSIYRPHQVDDALARRAAGQLRGKGASRGQTRKGSGESRIAELLTQLKSCSDSPEWLTWAKEL